MKSEFGLISWIRGLAEVPEGVVGIGDDCAIMPQAAGLDTLVSSDMLVEGTHFLMDDAGAEQLGWKSAAVNISDIAAMGGLPVGSFLAIALPRDLPEAWAEEFMRGYLDLSRKYGVPLLGGDTCASPDRLCISVTVLGSCSSGRALRRNSARPGDLVCVTGDLGDSAAGLQVILRGLDRIGYRRLVDRHYLPEPRVGEGLVLAATPGVHAMMDISDGVASDIRHIMEESGVGAEVDLHALPLSAELRAFCAEQGLDPVELAVSGGEDYELLFTMAPDACPAVPHTVIGRITEGRGLVWLGSYRDYTGFKHF